MKFSKPTGFFLLFLLFLYQIGFSQNKIDAELRNLILLQETKSSLFKGKYVNSIPLESKNNVIMTSVIVQSQNHDFSMVTQAGGILRTIAGPYATALVPVNKIKVIAGKSGVDYVAATYKLKTLNDVATDITGADQANEMGYTGEDVIIGVVDTGIDVKHPGFIGPNGTRVLYLWDQTAAGSGTDYPVYDYGIEWTKDQIDNGQCTSKDEDGHGTHVAGSIAQYMPPEQVHEHPYNGGLTKANLVIVKTNFDDATTKLDAISYIFEKAAELGKPAIVNLSIGSQIGPHDGTDPMCAFYDHLTGPGRLIFQSAGNDGASKIHHMVTADANGEEMEFVLEKEAEFLSFDMWYDGSSSVQLQVFGPGNNLLLTAPAGSKTEDTGVDTPYGQIYISNAAYGPVFYNGDKRIYMRLTEEAKAGQWKLRFSASTPTVVHAWMALGNKDAGFEFRTDDNHFTLINDACSRSVIAVGAMISKNRFKVRDYEGYPDGHEFVFDDLILGKIADYSSGGPTRDGRKKPELVAPGTFIGSAMSGQMDMSASFGTLDDFRSIGSIIPLWPTEFQGILKGTSMSVTSATGSGGIAASLNNEITPEMYKELCEHGVVTTDLEVNPVLKSTTVKREWNYLTGYGLLNMEKLINRKVSLVSCGQINGNRLELTLSHEVIGADNTANYQIQGPTSVSVVSASVSGKTVSLELNKPLKEGYQYSLTIQNIIGLEEPATIPIQNQKGTIVDYPAMENNVYWSLANSPYYIHKNVVVFSYARLKIEPGAHLVFMPGTTALSGLEISGALEARGTVDSPIIFEPYKGSGITDWAGLYFSSKIPNTTISHCRIFGAEMGIACLSNNLTVENCIVDNSTEIGILIQNCAPTIFRTQIINTKGVDFGQAIQLSGALNSPVLENLSIHNSVTAGIVCFNSNPQITNCILSKNSYGVYSDGEAAPSITYSNVWETSGIEYVNVSPGTGCISSNPQFMNSANNDLRLKDDSPCVDQGNPAQIDLDGSRIDMGALPLVSVPDLIFPEDGTINHRTDLELKWQKNKGGIEFEVVIATDDQFKNVHDSTRTTQTSFKPNELDIEITYFWRVKAFNGYCWSDWGQALFTTPVRQFVSEVPDIFALDQNYPNPFNPTTQINYQLPQAANIQIQIYNLHGQLIQEILNKEKSAGKHSAVWNCVNQRGGKVASGIYFYMLTAKNDQQILFQQNKKMVMMK